MYIVPVCRCHLPATRIESRASFAPISDFRRYFFALTYRSFVCLGDNIFSRNGDIKHRAAIFLRPASTTKLWKQERHIVIAKWILSYVDLFKGIVDREEVNLNADWNGEGWRNISAIRIQNSESNWILLDLIRFRQIRRIDGKSGMFYLGRMKARRKKQSDQKSIYAATFHRCGL